MNAEDGSAAQSFPSDSKTLGLGGLISHPSQNLYPITATAIAVTIAVPIFSEHPFFKFDYSRRLVLSLVGLIRRRRRGFGDYNLDYFFAINLASSAANTLICAGVMLPAISCGSSGCGGLGGLDGVRLGMAVCV